MKVARQIISNLLLMLAILLVFNFIAYHYLAKPILYHTYFIPDRAIREHHNFLLGDSHAEVINQSDLDAIHVLNFSASSESYFDVYAKLNYLLSKTRVDTVFLAVDNHTLSYYREYSTNQHRSIRYSRYRIHARYYKKNYLRYLFDKYVSIYLPLFDTGHSKLLGEKIKAVAHGSKPRDYSDFDFSQIPGETRVRRSDQRVSMHFPHNIPSKRVTSCLNEIITLCESSDIELIGIKFPLTREFYIHPARISYGADSILTARHHPVLDFEDLYLDRCDFFRDQDHLNNSGSTAFVEVWKDILGELPAIPPGSPGDISP